MVEVTHMRRANGWRLAGWGAAVALLAAPFVAMQLNADGVNWSAGDFLVMGVMLATVGGLIELAVRLTPSCLYRAGVGLAALGAFLLIWANLAVGMVGSEHNSDNQLFFVALLMGIAGSIGGGFKAVGMSRAMLTAAVSVGLAFVFAELGMRDEPMVRPLVEAIGTSVFLALFAASAWLFHKAARD